MNDDSGLRPSPAAHQPPAGGEGDLGRYRAGADGEGRDLLLDRAVALRAVGTATADDLQREARFLARLDHAGLPCVHDFVRGDGGALLVSRPTSGRTLTQAIAALAGGERIPALTGHAACVLTFIRVCEALAAAHLRGVVHRNLGPDTLVIGADGQVMIDGWRTAMEELERPATLRFISNAPVPAALPLDGLHEDIRGLGCCLYTALVLEAPPRNRDGALEGVTFAAALAIPEQLQAVVRKAMTSDAATGYSSVSDLRDDLVRFLAGQAPAAWKPGPFIHAVHWLDVNRRTVVAASLIGAVAVGAALIFTWNEVKTYAAWGPPLVDERFDDNSWKDRWAVRGGASGPGSWELRDGRLMTTADYDSYLVFKQRLSAPVAIEYTARFATDVRPGDLSAWWCEGDALAAEQSKAPFDLPGWFFQAGAYENSWCSIQQVPGQVRSAVANKTLAAGIDHVIRVEIEGGRLTMSIDGVRTLQHTSIFPATSGTIGLYGYFPGKSFDNVRIWQREVPELISPLALGDAAYRSGRLAEAAEDYRRVATSHAGTDLGTRALFLQGLTLRRLGDRVEARKVWQRMPDQELRQSAECLSIDDLAEAGQVSQAADRFLGMWKERPAMHDELRQRWQEVGQHLRWRSPQDPADLRLWSSVRDRSFGDDRASAWLGADLLMGLGAWEDVVKQFPEERRPFAQALLALGRSEEVATASWAVSNERIMARMQMGDIAGALASPDMHRDMRGLALCKQGRAEEVLRLGAQYPALLYLGRASELLDMPSLGSFRSEVLIVAGSLAAAAEIGDGRAMILLGQFDAADKAGTDTGFPRLLQLLAAGKVDEARKLRSQVTGNTDRRRNSLWFAQGIGLALADVELGEAGALRDALQRGAVTGTAWGGRQALFCRAALDANADAAVAAMPWRSEADAWGLLARAVRAEAAIDTSAALASWQAFAALPAKDRLLDESCLNVEVELVAAWRIDRLSRP